MRVIAGRWRGRPLVAPVGIATRPTADRVRETLFAMLASRLGSFEGLAVADLYAGSGALGIEALSRGAASCLFVDRDRSAITAIRANLDKLDAQGEILGTTAEKLPPGRKFDLVFADPPYAEGSGTKVVAAVLESAWLDTGGWLVVETARGDTVDPGPLELAAERDVGRARLTLMRY
jgi:16S rRNA (guanine966-N2)-methyltransferase